jgi:hypothetical protein
MTALAAWSPPALKRCPERAEPKAHGLDAVETAVMAGPRALAAVFRARRGAA